MAEADPDFHHAPFLRHLLCTAGQDRKRFAAFFLPNVEITPTHRFSDAGSECFRERFLGRKTRREMARRKFHRLRIGDLAFGENTLQKPVTEALDRVLNSCALNDVDTNSDDAHSRYSSIKESISRTAASIPANIARATMEWPILSSERCGILWISEMLR